MKQIKSFLYFSVISACILCLNCCSGNVQTEDSNKASAATIEKSKVENIDVNVADSDTASLANKEKVVVLDFFATWCGPCKAMAPAMDEMEKKYGEKIEFKKIDVDQNKELAMEFQISGVPTLVIVSPEGEIINKLVGYKDVSQLEEVFSNL